MIGKFTTDVLEKFVVEINKEENRKKIETNFVDPLVCYILDKIYPYIFATGVVFVLLLILATLILYLLIKKN